MSMPSTTMASLPAVGERPEKVEKCCDAYFVAFRYGNHAGPSGYDRFADYLGEKIEVSDRLRRLGETVLRPPAKFIERINGSYEYSRHDFVHELATLNHMRRHRDSLYHFLYAEKSLRFLAGQNRRRGHRVIGSFHHCAFKYPNYFRSTKHFRAIEHAVVVSRIQIDHMESIIGPGKVSFVPYAVDTSYFVPAESRAVGRPLRCACIGQHLRDLENLPAIIRGILSKVPDVEFYVIGAPPRFQESIESTPGAIWKRGISDAEYLEILQQTDLLVLPLLDSTSVTSVNEALACGVPVITNEGGVEDYLHEDCGVVLPVGDIDGMIDVVCDLLADENRRSRMSAAARLKGEELSWPNSARQMSEVYRKVMPS